MDKSKMEALSQKMNIKQILNETTKEFIPPTESEIDQTFEIIQDILEDPRINLKSNAEVKAGYEAALEVLDGNMQMEDIAQMPTGIQSRAIAVLALDYLKGECSQEVLVCVPLKVVPEKAYQDKIIAEITAKTTLSTKQADEIYKFYGFNKYKVDRLIEKAATDGKDVYAYFKESIADVKIIKIKS